MKNDPTFDRYDEFQQQAVLSVLDSFRQTPGGKFLLVVPTGGGKTFIAAKSVSRLFAEGILDRKTDRVLWVAHRQELLSQAKKTFKLLPKLYPDLSAHSDNIDFSMVGATRTAFPDQKNVKLVVIDEAHHGAADSYLPLFSRNNVGVLGLTATPTRHDGKPLEFQRECYSIGFPDLVEHGVILRPEVRTVRGGKFSIGNLTSDAELEQLNTAVRNQKIIDALMAHKDDYRKVVIYVGTKKHAEELCNTLRASALSALYESIGYVTGNKNSAALDRELFLEREKTFKRSILVNVQVLSEGYDDPKINTVVMAAPTRSKLVYMQAIGRAIRHDPENATKTAYIVEIVDELPNIKYRIDNRWLYSELSDALEPAVIDRQYSCEADLIDCLDDIYNEYHVPDSIRAHPIYGERERYGLLLFKVFAGGGEFNHYPMLIDGSNRLQVSNFFNFLSERMRSYRAASVNSGEALRMSGIANVYPQVSLTQQTLIFDAMINCVREDADVQASMPWITFVAFRLRRDPRIISEDLERFLDNVVNSSALREAILRREYRPRSVLIKFPLPVNGYVGRILRDTEFGAVQETVDALTSLREQPGDERQRIQVHELLSQSVLPIPQGDIASLTLIVRNDIDYFRPLG